jgi:hypothetical protein
MDTEDAKIVPALAGPDKPCGQPLAGLTSWRVMSSVGFTYGYPSSAPDGAT